MNQTIASLNARWPGRLTRSLLAALAAWMCGLLWELWNVNSLARWQYAIPHVHPFDVFEMPLLGFAGYLPFGLQCLAVGRLLDAD